MFNSLPLVSIITSTYKHEQYIVETIDSVLSQDYPKIEYIIVNDGSPDRTEEILKSYGDKINWKTQKNMGETPTLNNAFRQAKGDLIGKLSSDDYLYPTAISEAVNLFLSRPELQVVYSDFDLVDENGEIFDHIQKPDYDLVEVVKNHWCLPGPGTLFRREIFEALGGFNTQYRILFDMDFWWRAGLIGPFARIPKSLSAFRQHRESQSSTGGERMASETVRLVETYFLNQNLPVDIKKVKHEALANAYYLAGMQCLQKNNINLSSNYLKRSLFYFPIGYLRKSYREKLNNIFLVFISSLKIKIMDFLGKIVK